MRCRLALLVRVPVPCATIAGMGSSLLPSQSTIRSARPSGRKKGTFGMSRKTVQESKQYPRCCNAFRLITAVWFPWCRSDGMFVVPCFNSVST